MSLSDKRSDLGATYFTVRFVVATGKEKDDEDEWLLLLLIMPLMWLALDGCEAYGDGEWPNADDVVVVVFVAVLLILVKQSSESGTPSRSSASWAFSK